MWDWPHRATSSQDVFWALEFTLHPKTLSFLPKFPFFVDWKPVGVVSGDTRVGGTPKFIGTLEQT